MKKNRSLIVICIILFLFCIGLSINTYFDHKADELAFKHCKKFCSNKEGNLENKKKNADTATITKVYNDFYALNIPSSALYSKNDSKLLANDKIVQFAMALDYLFEAGTVVSSENNEKSTVIIDKINETLDKILVNHEVFTSAIIKEIITPPVQTGKGFEEIGYVESLRFVSYSIFEVNEKDIILNHCYGCGISPGPSDQITEYQIIDGYTENNKLYISTKLAFEFLLYDTNGAEPPMYGICSNYDDCDDKAERYSENTGIIDLIDAGQTLEDFSKYDTYQYTFKIVNNIYLFDNVKLVTESK